jgi:RNA polymerase sigma-70 factor (ECF subfamily)
MTSQATDLPTQARRLAAARQGDEDAFRALVGPHLAPLHRHCYRMLGSAQDAEDAVQDTLLRAWRAVPHFEGRSAFRSWLYRIATNTSINMLNRHPGRVLRIDGHPAGDPTVAAAAPLTESTWLEPIPDDYADARPSASPDVRFEERESLELAFVAALQHLPPRQRAVLILRDVLGFSGAEVAEMLDTIPSSVYSLLQRAHRSVRERIPKASQQETLRTLGEHRLREIVARYVAAWEAADVAALAALLTDDAVMTMPPRPTWFRGRDAVATFAAQGPLAPGSRWRMRPTRANGQVAFGCYLAQPDRRRWVGHGLQVLSFEPSGAIGELTAFLDPSLLGRFGLPSDLRD